MIEDLLVSRAIFKNMSTSQGANDDNNDELKDEENKDLLSNRGYGEMQGRSRFYVRFSKDVEPALDQATNNKNAFIDEVLRILLLGGTGDTFQAIRKLLRKSRLETLTAIFSFFREIPIAKIHLMAVRSRRDFFPMLLYIFDLGLRQYEKTEGQDSDEEGEEDQE